MASINSPALFDISSSHSTNNNFNVLLLLLLLKMKIWIDYGINSHFYHWFYCYCCCQHRSDANDLMRSAIVKFKECACVKWYGCLLNLIKKNHILFGWIFYVCIVITRSSNSIIIIAIQIVLLSAGEPLSVFGQQKNMLFGWTMCSMGNYCWWNNKHVNNHIHPNTHRVRGTTMFKHKLSQLDGIHIHRHPTNAI